MIEFTKNHKYLICIDSDGTVMDTMTIKHNRCFGPCMLEVFGVTNHVEEILDHWNNTNLYTLTRGINRFQGLEEILKFIDSTYDIKFAGVELFYNWVDTTPKFSVELLKEEINKYPDNIVLKKALEWSNLVNERITKLPPSMEFDNVRETLITLSKFADLLCVSSANKQAVEEEWVRRDLKKYFKFIACQDVGSKSTIIHEALKLGYSKNDVIMLGDALGDLKAAKDNDVYFYPIIPSKEKDSWKTLNDEVSSLIENGRYDSSLEKVFIDEFNSFLKNGGK